MVKERLQTALLENRFLIALQSVVAVDTWKLIHQECLIRYKAENGALFLASEIIPFIEEQGAIAALDLFTMETACQKLRHNEGLSLSVNVSRRSIKNESLLSYMKSNIGPDIQQRLIIEITETALPDNKGDLVEFIKFLRNLNLRIAIDDFGVGATLLDDIGALDFDILKLDKIFADTDASQNLTLAKTMEFVKQRGLFTIAEGVEDRLTAKKMQTLGVDALQGYLFGRPTL